MKKLTAILAATIVLLGVLSCKKTDTPKPEVPAATAKSSDYKKGDFVFSVSNLRKITHARSVNGDGDGVVPSHLYVRFMPITQAHISAIEEKRIPTYPYPLATDSLDVSNPDYSKLYTFLPISKSLPACPYEILDTVMMLMPETEGVAAAYVIAGIPDRIPLISNGATLPRSPLHDLTPMPCDQWSDPEDYENPSTICDDAPPPPADPPPTPAPLNPTDPRTTPSTVSYNSCIMNTDVNYASGRILVEETQWGNGGVAFEGVADVKVEILGPNGQRVVAQTNRYGCFKATGAIRGFRLPFGVTLPVVQNVIFESGRKEIRGYNDMANLAQYTLPLKHIYANIAERMNSADIYYRRNTDNQDNSCKYYVAATVNNALYEYGEYAAADGILIPPDNLKILVHRFGRDGAAPMFNNLKNTHPIDYMTVKAFFDGTTLGLGNLLSNTPPDIVIGYAWDADHFHTDRIKEVAYHEFSHASHYRKTDFQLWADNINFVAHYLGYGSTGNAGVEKIDLAEMWGYFMGYTYVHRRYGPSHHSRSTAPTFANSWWQVFLEQQRFFDENNPDPSKVHIPYGFLHDLVDDNTQLPSTENANVTDSIHGYTIGGIYSFLDGSTNTAVQLINKLGNNLPAGATNTQANYILLRNSYGY